MLVVLVGAIGRIDGEPGLIDGDGDCVRLDWIAARLSACHAGRLIVGAALVGEPLDAPTPLLSVLASERTGVMLVELERSGGGALDALVGGLRGAAIDLRRGAITAASLAEHLQRAVPGATVGQRGGHAVLLDVPPLERIWDLGWSIHGSLRAGLPLAVAAPIDDSALLGAVLPGRFRVDAALGAGGFAAVYRARQLAIDRDVAVKVLRGGVDPFSEDGRLFVHEIQAVGRIDHPNVVRVYQADVTADGRLFFAMELLAGRDLQSVIADGVVALPRALALAAQLLAALEAAHQVGLVHADVKPANAIVVGTGAGERLVLLDFGLARLRARDDATTSVGGTPAFMAPEQLRDSRVDARSDQFSAALVVIAMLTGWRRRRAVELAPPADVLATITDDAVRAALARGLAIDPDARFASAAAFAAALTGAEDAAIVAPARPPFHGLAAFTEDDRGRLYGRDRELEQLTELALYRRLVIVTAPSGVGKTSLLRAGLSPRLTALGARAHYASCRTDSEATVAAAISPGATALAAAISPGNAALVAAISPGASVPGAVVLIVDQVESCLETAGGELLDAVLALVPRRLLDATVLLSVREDFLARLLDRMPARGDGAPIVRIGPLDPAGAKDAIVRPLAERRLALAPELLDRLLADLTAAGTRLGTELGWSAAAPIYPPHLQLACSVLHARLPADATTLTLDHYRALGGFDAIVGEHLDRVLDDLSTADAAIARDLFLALVTAAHGRTARTDDELRDTLPATARDRLVAVLDLLRAQGLVVRTRRAGGDAVWELIHDSLVPRVLSWLDRRDLARRRALELLRYHLRRSRPDAPSLLSRAELRELDSHPNLLADLQAEWDQHGDLDAARSLLRPLDLVATSRRVHRRATIAGIALAALVAAGLALILYQRWASQADRRAEDVRRDRDLGRYAFELAPFDWNPTTLTAIPVSIAELPDLTWTLHSPSASDLDEPGEPIPASRLHRILPRLGNGALSRIDGVEAPGGPAFLVITGRGRPGETCAPSIIPLRNLPGYARPGAVDPVIQIRVPTCQATLADTLEIPAGDFIFGGLGEPPSAYKAEFRDVPPEATINVPAFRIDRTEVTNAAFSAFGSMSVSTGIAIPAFSDSRALKNAGGATYPAVGLFWEEARAYCRFLGKDLPSSAQWEKAMRGAKVLPLGEANPFPKRAYPWGVTVEIGRARLRQVDHDAEGPAPVDSFPDDRSPYGVMDMAGNVQEWTTSIPPDGRSDFRVARGGYWEDTTIDNLGDFMVIENPRLRQMRHFAVGLRCTVAQLF